VYETLRMLGEQHELDLEREAMKSRLAASVRSARIGPQPASIRIVGRTWVAFVRSRLATLLR